MKAIGIGVALLGGVIAPCALAATGSAVSGTVRSADGTPQMGTLIELLTPSATLIAQAITDEQGHYLLRIAQAGMYQLRVSSALLAPAWQSNLVLRSGADTIANLTLPAAVQPRSVKVATSSVEHRPDDWRWVLRSTANRPLLRWVDDNGASTGSGGTVPEGTASGQARLSRELRISGGSGVFGEGPARATFVVGHLRPDGVARLQASVGGDGGPTVAAFQLERKHQAGSRRIALVAQAHPELVDDHGAGYSVLQTAATQTFALGDLVQVDVGTLLTAERLVGTHLQSSPYLRLGLAPSESLSLEYSYATDRALQAAGDLDAEPARQPEILTNALGQPVSHAGAHHALTATRVLPAAVVSVAVYHDDLPVEAVQGMGALNAQDVTGQPIVLDRTTSTFRVTATGLQGAGVHASWSAAVHSAASVHVDAALGRVASAPEALPSVSSVAAEIRSREAAMVHASLHTANSKAGTAFEASYRWQPHWSLSQVDAFDAEASEAYLSCILEQRLWSGSHAEHIEAILRASNLLAEGYVPVLSSDGRTLYLAQVPRTVQASLAFRF